MNFVKQKQTLTHASEKTHIYIRFDMLLCKGKEPKHARKPKNVMIHTLLAFC
jgi:hypothetical protein